MERNGVLIDMQQLARQGQELGQKMLELEQRAHELAGGPFNLGSPKQLAEILFERMGLQGGEEDAVGRARRPTRRCWRSSPRTIRCAARCSTTARSRS